MSGTHAREAKENVNILVMKREWWMKVNRTLPTSISFQNLKLIPHFITPTRSLPSSYLFCLSSFFTYTIAPTIPPCQHLFALPFQSHLLPHSPFIFLVERCTNVRTDV